MPPRKKTPTKGLRFNEKAHRYTLDGAHVPGVTTILGVIDKPGLISWAAKSVAEHVADNIIEVQRMIWEDRDNAVSTLSKIPHQTRDKASTRGTAVHEICEQILRGETVNPDTIPDPEVARRATGAVDFMRDWRVKPIIVEQAVGSREHQYAGKLDLVAEVTNPHTGEIETAIIDWKTSKAIYSTVAYQLNAYGHAEFHGEGGDETPMSTYGITKAYGVRLDDGAYGIYEAPFNDETHETFLNVLKVFKANRRDQGDWRKPGSGIIGTNLAQPQVEEVF